MQLLMEGPQGDDTRTYTREEYDAHRAQVEEQLQAEGYGPPAAHVEIASQRPTVESIHAATDRLSAAIEAFQDSATYTAWLQAAGKFHHYSLNNQMLIVLQLPSASYVNSFKRWLDLGRCVRKGEKAIRIMAPCIRTKKHQEPQEEPIAAESVTRQRRPTGEPYAYPMVPVFDYSQTEPLPEHPSPWTTDTMAAPTLTHDAGQELYERVLAHLDFIAVTHEEFAEDGSSHGGYYDASRWHIAVKADRPRLAMLKTLLHETAHHYASPTRSTRTKEQEEVIADSVAYVVASHFGYDTEAVNAAYVACWMQEDPAAFKTGLAEIVRISRELIEVLAA